MPVCPKCKGISSKSCEKCFCLKNGIPDPGCVVCKGTGKAPCLVCDGKGTISIPPNRP